MSALWLSFAEYAQSLDERDRSCRCVEHSTLLTRARQSGAYVLVFLDKVSHWAAVSRQRRQLAALSTDASFLSDVGLSRSDALQEANKPFWRP